MNALEMIDNNIILNSSPTIQSFNHTPLRVAIERRKLVITNFFNLPAGLLLNIILNNLKLLARDI